MAEIKIILDIETFTDPVDFVENYNLQEEYLTLFNGRVDDYVHEQQGYSFADVINNLVLRLEEREDCYSTIYSRDGNPPEYTVELYDIVEENES
jgi:hypothetical protein